MVRHYAGENYEQTQEERKKKAPQRLPEQRPRALTSTCVLQVEKSTLQGTQTQTCNQSQSLLFARLAREVRQLIWSEVLGGHLLHIARYPKRLLHGRLLAIECSEYENRGPEHELETSRHGCWGLANRRRELGSTPGFYYLPISQHPAKPASLLPLLQTCRRIYLETISMPYTGNIFDVNHIDTLMYFQQSVLPQRLTQIRVLNLSWNFKLLPATSLPPYDLDTWREACDVLAASFAGLSQLTVHLTGGGALWPGTRYKDRWGPIIEALMPIKAKKFEVFLPWSEGDCTEATEEGGYPFKLLPKSPEMPTSEVQSSNFAIFSRMHEDELRQGTS
jgi:hypothetical protein